MPGLTPFRYAFNSLFSAYHLGADCSYQLSKLIGVVDLIISAPSNLTATDPLC